MNERRARGREVQVELIPATADVPVDDDSFGHELRELAQEFVFGDLWTRNGLDRRSRSLVTLGILIALRAEGELTFHFPIAQRNGLTPDELAEVIYHSAAYAGFPAAASALAAARQTSVVNREES